MQDTYIPVCRFIKYIEDILVYLYYVCMLIYVLLCLEMCFVFGGKGETVLPVSFVVAVLGPT